MAKLFVDAEKGRSSWLMRKVPIPRWQTSLKLLVVDDRVPEPALGYGYPRSYQLLTSLAAAGNQVDLYPLRGQQTSLLAVRSVAEAGIRIHRTSGQASQGQFEKWYSTRYCDYDAVLVSRYGNLKATVNVLKAIAPQKPLIYDAEAVTAPRTASWHAHYGGDNNVTTVSELLKQEIEVISRSDVVLAVCERDRQLLSAGGIRDVLCLGHVHPPVAQRAGFSDRSGILFLGGFYGLEPKSKANCSFARNWWDISPNEDSLRWYLSAVQPILGPSVNVRLTVAGYNSKYLCDYLPPELLRGIQLLGFVEDVEALYDSVRVFVAPTRYAAGLPWKVTESLSNGVPVVATKLIRSQLGDTSPVYAADSPEEFAAAVRRLNDCESIWEAASMNSVEYVSKYCSANAFNAEFSRLGQRLYQIIETRSLSAARRLGL